MSLGRSRPTGRLRFAASAVIPIHAFGWTSSAQSKFASGIFAIDTCATMISSRIAA